jgi:hypothetical protein
MSHSTVSRTIFLRTVAFLAVLALVAVPAQAALEESRSFASDRLKVRNLIGEITVEGHRGSGFEVEVRVSGRDARDGLIQLQSGDDELNVQFPAGQTEYVYPKLGDRSKTEVKLSQGSFLSELIPDGAGMGRVKIRGSGQGLELWADVTVRVPLGGELEIEHGVGKVVAENVDGDLELATRSGGVSVERASGTLSVATGSGRVTLTRVNGESVKVATGSGNIMIEDCDGEEMKIATGSGGVNLESLRGHSIEIGTGSGEIRAERIDADTMNIGTGSGTVTLTLDRMGEGKFNVGTGSGDIVLTMPPGASADVHAETNSGEIEVDLGKQAQFSKQEKDEVRLTVGNGGASVDLGTGSGDIRIRS